MVLDLCLEFLDQKLVSFNFLDRILLFRFFSTNFWYVSTFATQHQSVRLCSTQFRYVSYFSTKFQYVTTFLTKIRYVSIFSNQFRHVSTFETKFWYVLIYRPEKKNSTSFDAVQICFNFLERQFSKFKNLFIRIRIDTFRLS